ncbi:DUF4150 domain-containing protein [Salmonella bongori serovar 48:i:- str. 94-0708]|uniref:DUF4150 domain-containing protein n=1 Tax=Salmonella bongori TaxID=54736 RepID=UPI0009A9905C|nr:DUF4150 domain-containing protein [Salmonella bongori]EGE4660856.1 DUF4150 domain-containing protein [Salmonella bongori serovar 48:i:- str. 94-0708]
MLTININGLTLCHKGSNGISHNTLPDVCKTPPFGVPVAYENEACSADLVKGTVSVFADGGNMIANMGSQFARSVFDEPGSMGGVLSGTNKAETDWISHSFDVFFEKKPACRLTDKLFMNHHNTVNMAGLCQESLSDEELDDIICKHALDCYTTHCNNLKSQNPEGEYFTCQKCLEDKLREEAYNGRYPSDECKIWTEVHFDKALELIYSGTQEGAPSARYYTPKGGRRMDIIQLDRDGKPRRLIDVKFPTDRDLTPDRARDYRKMAKKLDSEYDTFNVKKRCPGWPKTCPNEKPQEQPQTETQPEEKSASAAQYAILGGLVVVAVIATLCPFDGPAGDIVTWGAVSTQAGSMAF